MKNRAPAPAHLLTEIDECRKKVKGSICPSVYTSYFRFSASYTPKSVLSREYAEAIIFSMNKDWQSFLHEKGEYDYYSAYVVLEHAGF